MTTLWSVWMHHIFNPYHGMTLVQDAMLCDCGTVWLWDAHPDQITFLTPWVNKVTL